MDECVVVAPQSLISFWIVRIYLNRCNTAASTSEYCLKKKHENIGITHERKTTYEFLQYNILY